MLAGRLLTTSRSPETDTDLLKDVIDEIADDPRINASIVGIGSYRKYRGASLLAAGNADSRGGRR